MEVAATTRYGGVMSELVICIPMMLVLLRFFSHLPLGLS